MAFRPQVNDQLTINNVTYSIAEHPAAPDVPYGQAGRRAIVYQVAAGEDHRALKVFSHRFRTPALVLVAQNLFPYASLPGLQVCERQVLTPERHGSLLQQHTDLAYAVLMPWIEGPTWMEAMIQKQALTPEESLALARSLAGTLAQMEEQGLAHCDLAGSNVMLPPEGGVVLVDVEEMHGPEFERPEVLPSGSSGYGHREAGEGLWGPDADRFAGAVLLAEMLGWCDERVQEAAWGEQYFVKEEVQEDTERYRLLLEALREQWGEGVVRLFEQAWQSEILADCPAFGEWLTTLPEEVGAVGTVIDEAEVDGEQAEAPEPGWKVVGEEPEPELAPDVQEQLVQARLLAGEALLRAEQPGRALVELEAAYEMDPEAAGELLAQALVAQAQKAEETGDTEGALEGYRRAVEVAPEESALREEVGGILSEWEEQWKREESAAAAEVLEEEQRERWVEEQSAVAEVPPVTIAEEPVLARRRVSVWVLALSGLVILVVGYLLLGGGGLVATRLRSLQAGVEQEVVVVKVTATPTAVQQPDGSILKESMQLEIQADKGWQATGIHVQEGDNVIISYVSGLWSPWPGDYVDAEGVPSFSHGGANIVNGCGHAALIARVADNQPFCVGDGFSGQVEQSGSLQLRTNDNVVTDNSGKINVRIEVGQ